MWLLLDFFCGFVLLLAFVVSLWIVCCFFDMFGALVHLNLVVLIVFMFIIDVCNFVLLKCVVFGLKLSAFSLGLD